jgi:hypothetical protein
MAESIREVLDGTASPSPNIQQPAVLLPTWLSLEHQAAQLRKDVAALARQTEDTHHRTTRQALAELTQLYLQRTADDVLRFLSENVGMSWSDIALVVGVSVQAIRKWRLGGPVAPANRQALAELAAFTHHLLNLHIAEPASWLSLPMVPGYRVTRLDLYRANLQEHLCAHVRLHATPEQVMDLYEPQWRDRLRLEHEVFRAEDGYLASRPKK